MNNQIKIALAGQQNAGKSTLFNVLTGARQHVANYPGVTVDKKYGRYNFGGTSVVAVDLPGTYSLTSFSLEERVARDFLIRERPDVAVNVVDSSNLRRSLHLTFQLLEMGLKSVLALNMMDMAKRRGISIDIEGLARRLCLPVVETIGSKGVGRDELRRAIQEEAKCAAKQQQMIDYGPLEPVIAKLSLLVRECASEWTLPPRWLAIKLLEQDAQAQSLLKESAGFEWADEIVQKANDMADRFERQEGLSASDHIITMRDRHVAGLLSEFVTGGENAGESITNKIDRFVLHRWAAPAFLVFTVYMIYQISIVWGYELTNHTWPFLAKFREIVAGLLPSAGFLEDPYTRSMGLWLVDSANTLLNYVPIFLILFALIAILEDSGYMARIAFILDKVLHRFGLHGQSTLPLILGGVFAGGCAVPGIMATKGIPDNRARMATIFAVPFMNCLAKVPLYTLLLGIFFVENKSLMTFYISTMTIIFALLVSKLLTITVLKGHETSPFVMELPAYHVPTVTAVLRRSFERTWIYIKKVGTIVVAVAVVVFSLLQFPGLPDDRMDQFEADGLAAIEAFQKSMNGNAYEKLAGNEHIVPLVNFYTDFKRAKLNAGGAAGSKAVNETFSARNGDYYPLVKAPKGDKDAKKAGRALKKLVKARKSIRRVMKEERITNSVLGMIGRSMEPATQFAGFDWKINVALLSSFAARESSVATLGVLFQQDEDQNATLEERMGTETQAAGATALLAVSMILFFALYPPCLATTVMVKVQTGSYKWMLQIQRGVGTSTNGAGAFGATINLNTAQKKEKAYLQTNASIGSFNTLKGNVNFGTGLLDNKFSLDGRLSRIGSDGYIDRARADLSSWFLSGAYYGNKNVIRFNAFSGHEVTYQAWNGVPAGLVDDPETRTFNSAGTEKEGEPYDNEVDDYRQTHYQLFFDQQIGINWDLSLGLHLTQGEGFFEQYKADQDLESYGIAPTSNNIFTSDLIRRLWLDNDFYGTVYALRYQSPDKQLTATLGGSYHIYEGRHFGEVIWARNASNSEIRHRYYDNDAEKKDFNIYGKINYALTPKLNAYLDLQWRQVNYDFLGITRQGTQVPAGDQLSFFNPKAGLVYKLTDRSELYASYALANREPNRNDYTQNPVGSWPLPERLYNTEIGWRHQGTRAVLGINLYHMNYQDESLSNK